jgi:hypothetical protein
MANPTNSADYDSGMARLDGTRIGPRRVAYYADEISAWCVVRTADVAELGRLMRDEEIPDAYSEWCAWTVSRDLTPAERRALGV